MTYQLYRHFDKEGTLLYVGISYSAVERQKAHQRKATWFESVSRIDIETFESREDVEKAERKAILYERPIHNKVRYVGRFDEEVITYIKTNPHNLTTDELIRSLHLSTRRVEKIRMGQYWENHRKKLISSGILEKPLDTLSDFDRRERKYLEAYLRDPRIRRYGE